MKVLGYIILVIFSTLVFLLASIPYFIFPLIWKTSLNTVNYCNTVIMFGMNKTNKNWVDEFVEKIKDR